MGVEFAVDNAVSILEQYGMAYCLLGGIQIDIVPAFKSVNGELFETSACNLNCTRLVGGYDCNSAITRNKGLDRRTIAPGAQLLEWIDPAVEGLFTLRSRGYMEELLDRLPGMSTRYLRRGILSLYHDPSAKVEVNLFGGSPGLHPELLSIISQLRTRPVSINLTDHGVALLQDDRFAAQLMEEPPDVLALSLDDITPGEFRVLSRCDKSQLGQMFGAIRWDHGQEKKATAAIGAARLWRDVPNSRLLFNMVLHPGNLGHFFELTELVQEEFPNAIINPFPAQSSFDGETPVFAEPHLPALSALIDKMIAWTLAGKAGFSKRLHYWLFLKSFFTMYPINERPANGSRVLALLSGYDGWRCYKPDSGRYVQIGKGPHGAMIKPGAIPGGHLGCYWNSATVTAQEQIQSAEDVIGHLCGGAELLAAQSGQRCAGCIMPRLVYDLPNLMAGMDIKLIPAFDDLMGEWLPQVP